MPKTITKTLPKVGAVKLNLVEVYKGVTIYQHAQTGLCWSRHLCAASMGQLKAQIDTFDQCNFIHLLGV